jgi:hypothetical protein
MKGKLYHHMHYYSCNSLRRKKGWENSQEQRSSFLVFDSSFVCWSETWGYFTLSNGKHASSNLKDWGVNLMHSRRKKTVSHLQNPISPWEMCIFKASSFDERSSYSSAVCCTERDDCSLLQCWILLFCLFY